MTLYVGNIPYTVSEKDLQSAFSAYGNVESVKIIKDRETGRSKGFAFVEFTSDDEGREAARSMNGYQINGRPLKVNEARQK